MVGGAIGVAVAHLAEAPAPQQGGDFGGHPWLLRAVQDLDVGPLASQARVEEDLSDEVSFATWARRIMSTKGISVRMVSRNSLHSEGSLGKRLSCRALSRMAMRARCWGAMRPRSASWY